MSLVLTFAAAAGGSVPNADSGQGGTEAEAPQGSIIENVIVDKGVRVEFSIEAAKDASGKPRPVTEGEYAEVSFTITDAATGAPVSPLEPAVWITRSRNTEDISCRDRISSYTQGLLSFQADIDLNKYFILIMNNDRTISVVAVSLKNSGITQLYTMINLKENGEDWEYSPDGRHLFVSLPKADSVAVVDLENFKIIETVAAGKNPVRVALQPDGRYLWVGNDGKAGAESGVTVIDTQNYKIAAHVPTGAGHHEITFSDDSLQVYVTNSLAGTVSLIDTQQLQKIKDLPVGKSPVAIQFSPLSKMAYVATEGDGVITVVDGTTHKASARIQTDPGLIALRAAPGGRWLFAANIKHDRVDVIDATTGSITHRFDAADQPHQFAFTDTYAYVRHLGTAEVTMIPLGQLGAKASPALHTVALGKRAPGEYKLPTVADMISPTGEWAAVVAANPADRLIYYYMEGMIAPMGSYSTYGRVPRAIGVVDRSVREVEKGVYAAKIRVPEAGTYNVAFIIDSPLVDQCFTFTAGPNPLIEAKKEKYPLKLEFINTERIVSVGEPFTVEFSLRRSSTDKPLGELKDVLVLATRMPGNWQKRQRARSVGEGRYAVSIMPDQAGVYLVTVGVPSFGVDMTQLPYRSFRAVERKASKN
jgi:YVTN family beta-propeller protein